MNFNSTPLPVIDTSAKEALVPTSVAAEERNGQTETSFVVDHIKNMRTSKNFFSDLFPKVDKQLWSGNPFTNHEWKDWANEMISTNLDTKDIDALIAQHMMKLLGPEGFFRALDKAAKDTSTKALAKKLEETQFKIWDTLNPGGKMTSSVYTALQLGNLDVNTFNKRLPILFRYYRHFMDKHFPRSAELPLDIKDSIDKETVKRFGPYWADTTAIAALLGLNFESPNLFKHPAINIWLDVMKMCTSRQKLVDPLIIRTFQWLGARADMENHALDHAILDFADRWNRENVQPFEVLTILGLSLNHNNLASQSAFPILKAYLKQFVLKPGRKNLKSVHNIFYDLAVDQSDVAAFQRTNFVSFFVMRDFDAADVATILGIETTFKSWKQNVVWIIWVEYVVEYLRHHKTYPVPIEESLKLLSLVNNGDLYNLSKFLSGFEKIEFKNDVVKKFLDRHLPQPNHRSPERKDPDVILNSLNWLKYET
ncbi:hypothetical protein CCR75_008225 [Bremia lactucae]|uniref:RxLR effector protein n=1 Tax=Bremia lactucae TaxID=4779 RepID=A0A976FNU5_BRELC|nr:hypothetical protein CCR75_008225 [Bremia lactucae]